MVILNIKMPLCCADCPMYDDRWDYPTCYVTDESRGYKFDIFNKRMPSCPLKEIKTVRSAHHSDDSHKKENIKVCGICGKEMKLGDYYTLKNKHQDNLCKECRCQGCFDDKPWTYFSLMKEFDIPYIEEIWFQQMIREFKKAIRTYSYRNVFGKYLSTMKLFSWKPFGFKDSQELNYYHSSVKNNLLRDILLDKEIPQEYFDVIETNIKQYG